MTSDGERLLTVAEAAAILNVPKSALYRWSSLGQGPPTVRIGHRLRYRLSGLEDWLDDQQLPRTEVGQKNFDDLGDDDVS